MIFLGGSGSLEFIKNFKELQIIKENENLINTFGSRRNNDCILPGKPGVDVPLSGEIKLLNLFLSFFSVKEFLVFPFTVLSENGVCFRSKESVHIQLYMGTSKPKTTLKGKWSAHWNCKVSKGLHSCNVSTSKVFVNQASAWREPRQRYKKLQLQLQLGGYMAQNNTCCTTVYSHNSSSVRL